MTDPPGQVAYEAFWHRVTPELRGDPWHTLPPPDQVRWEAAAQAVLAWQAPQQEAPPCPP